LILSALPAPLHFTPASASLSSFVLTKSSLISTRAQPVRMDIDPHW
jgi:hypothetical protein